MAVHRLIDLIEISALWVMEIGAQSTTLLWRVSSMILSGLTAQEHLRRQRATVSTTCEVCFKNRFPYVQSIGCPKRTMFI